MFKNPLKKYQQGGQVSQEQQQMLAAFVEWLPKRVKEFQGMQPEQIVEALNGMAKSPEGQKQVQAYMQQFQQEMQNPQAGMFENGGKLQDFICKHAKGGHVAGCGCKEDGGKVEKAKDGYKVKNGSYEASVKAPEDTTRSKQYKYTTEIMHTLPGGAVNYRSISNNNGYTNSTWDISNGTPTFWQRVAADGLISTLLNNPKRVSPSTKENWENIISNHPEDPRNALKKENGGVVKGQNSIPGGIPAEPPTGYNGEIRQYIDRRNPIRRRIDNFVENNPYARKIVSLGKGIKESSLGVLLPDLSNGVAGAIAPAGKISNLGKSLSRAEQTATRLPKSAFEKYAGEAVDEGDDLVKVFDYEIPTNNNTYVDRNLDFTSNYNQYIDNFDFNNITKPNIWSKVGQAIEASPWIGIPAVTGYAIYKSEKDKKKKKENQQNK